MPANLLRDMRLAIRQFAKNPAFTVVALLTLGVGIGANSAIFSLVNGVLLRPLPYPEPDALVRVHEIVPPYGRFPVAPASFLDWQQQNTSFERIAAYSVDSAAFDGGDMPERVVNAPVSWDMFDLLRVKPLLGRSFVQAEDMPGRNRVIVLSHGMWQRRFGGDRSILNRSATFDGAPYTIIGVMPQGFAFPMREVEYWRPIGLNAASPPRGAHFLGVIARLNRGVAREQARGEMKAIAERLAKQYPESGADESAEVVTLHEQMVARIRPALLTLLAAVGLVVLIACGNVANLLLVRASVREKEIAIRTALGAGRRRIAIQMLAESLVLALAGGAIGLGLAYLVMGPVQTLGAGRIPRMENVAVDRDVLAFTLLLSMVTGVVFGMVPAWQASRVNLNEVLKAAGHSSTSSGGRWVLNGLVVAEVALSLVLLVGASLLLRSFAKLTSVDSGFRAEDVLTFDVSLPEASYAEESQRIAFYDRLLERILAVPLVRSAGMVQALPVRDRFVLSFSVQGRPEPPPGQSPSANYRVVSPGYFETMGIRLRRGRVLTAHDMAGGPMVALVDEVFARQHFPNEDPIGRGIDIDNGTDGLYEIVGVVSDVRHDGLDTGPAPTMYVPYRYDAFGTMWIVARTAGNPADIAAAVREVLRGLDRGLPAGRMRRLADVVSASVADRKFSMLLLGLFAIIALFLAAVGLYGVTSYSVGQRRQEMGVRLSLGASPGHLLGRVIVQGMKLVIAGAAIGLAAALLLTRLMSTMLFQVTLFDPPSYATTALVLLVAALLACYVPARRAMRVDPIVALRSE